MKYLLEEWLENREQPRYKFALEDWLRTKNLWKTKEYDVTSTIVNGGCVVLALNNKRI